MAKKGNKKKGGKQKLKKLEQEKKALLKEKKRWEKEKKELKKSASGKKRASGKKDALELVVRSLSSRTGEAPATVASIIEALGEECRRMLPDRETAGRSPEKGERLVAVEFPKVSESELMEAPVERETRAPMRSPFKGLKADSGRALFHRLERKGE